MRTEDNSETQDDAHATRIVDYGEGHYVTRCFAPRSVSGYDRQNYEEEVWVEGVTEEPDEYRRSLARYRRHSDDSQVTPRVMIPNRREGSPSLLGKISSFFKNFKKG
jgi:hypothetical protein